ncbi:ABC transporter permease/M1 family aminopeptidase [Olivibacter sitiensis]|uniref:ABC transporter permease/M1 family aminopeptidase n=1 Tax=Olivibacter sitiensis TaxID=376470 RepID=UPI00041A9F96|nr:M1 family aminopeptidase [Olivibacter sitiensis]
MFKEIYFFELRQGFKKPATYIYFSIYFGLSLVVGMAIVGYFNTATTDTNTIANSTYAVSEMLVGFNDSILGLVNSVILVAIMATAIQKDYEYNTHPLFFTKPIKKSTYFFGRFLGAFTLALLVFFGQVIGYFTGTLFGLGTDLVGPFHAWSFLSPFLVFTVPNLLLLGIIFFSLTTFTRNTLTAYLLCIILLIIRIVSDTITADLDNKTMAALLEPFGANALQLATQYWTPSEQNSLAIPLSGILLYNRLLWLAIAIAITAISYRKFHFSQFLAPAFKINWFSKKSAEGEQTAIVSPFDSLARLPKVTQVFSWKQGISQCLYLAKFEFKKLIGTTFFIVLCALGIVMMVIISQFMGSMYDTETYPVTYQILEVASGGFLFFILIILVFFAGNSIWRERENRLDELVGASPVSNVVLFFSKYLALIFVLFILLSLVLLTGVGVQLSQGFTQINLTEYMVELYGKSWLSMSITAGLCMAVQVLSPNKYLGFFISLVPILFINILFGLLEWNDKLYIFNSSGPRLPYSDMNGFGHTLPVYYLYKAYWLNIVLFLMLVSLLFFPRGKEKNYKAKYRLSGKHYGIGYKVAMLATWTIAFSCGAYIYYNTHVLHVFRTALEIEQLQADYEKTFKPYERIRQARITHALIDVDIYPDKRSLATKGYYFLKNKHEVPLDTLYINYQTEEDSYYFSELAPDRAHTVLQNDSIQGVKIFVLREKLQPGDSLKLSFAFRLEPNGFSNNNPSTDVVHNGSFFNNMLLPSIGYESRAELSANSARKKYGLPPKERMAKVDDMEARMNNYLSKDADWIRFETKVSTSVDQIAIAPGYLQKEWEENGRRYFHYTMDSPILNFYSYLSANYEVKKDKWKDVDIEVYYHKGHEYNLERMIKSVQHSLDYYTANFGPYQHRQVRIIEFPRYASFAQSFPNTIPYSESIGFITKVDDSDKSKIDVPFYVTAHEVAHQWWGHQVVGGNVQGSVLMSESMSQYSALMVMEKEYGRDKMKKFLRYEMDNYLKGRTSEGKKEMPLMLVENQAYIHYNKGSVVMYALRDYLGEDTLNKALRNYLQKTAFQEPPYTNSIEFVNTLREATPDSLKYIIKDMFEDITLYENYVKDLSYTKRQDGKYVVNMTLGSQKFKADSLGKQVRVPVNDYIDIGIFSNKDSSGEDIPLLLQKIKMDEPLKAFTFTVDREPTSAGLDPYNKLIDRNPDNNTWKFGSTPPPVRLDDKEETTVTIKVGE